ncbi:MAG TPA: hypothetical protein DCK99_20155 [Blastocatellia bacterium]|nr:hypothetical protein [Blastocatellia bacterium]
MKEGGFSFNRQHALGPKNRQLVAPFVRTGNSILSIAQGPKGRHKSWRTFGAQATNRRIYPTLTRLCQNSVGERSHSKIGTDYRTVGGSQWMLPLKFGPLFLFQIWVESMASFQM